MNRFILNHHPELQAFWLLGSGDNGLATTIIGVAEDSESPTRRYLTFTPNRDYNLQPGEQVPNKKTDGRDVGLLISSENPQSFRTVAKVAIELAESMESEQFADLLDTEKTDEDLLPCPFCKTAESLEIGPVPTVSCGEQLPKTDERCWWAVQCVQCGMHGPVSRPKNGAATAWNLRLVELPS